MSPGPRRRDSRTALLFLAPAFVIIGIFGLLPILDSLYLSLFRWGLRPGPFLGLGNFEELFGGWQNLLIVVVLVVAIALTFRALKAQPKAWIRWTARTSLAALTLGLFVFLGRVWSDGDSQGLKVI